ncbi:MAG TPA: hypothetical protein VHL55_05615 [Acidimicrobiia bacterium]|jgi:hypothetical protein|nr:hypothetical protein [Acidimicrobiia bacterium]
MNVHEWLLDADPAIRWQVMRDLMGSSPSEVAAERSRVAADGWGAQLLAIQQPNGGWSSVEKPTRFVETPDGSATHALALLVDMGLDPASEPARHAVELVSERVRFYEGNQPFFSGEVEACINGRVLGIGAYFGRPDDMLAQRLVGEQLEDGGWNCDAPPSTRGSFHSTICVLEGLLAYEQAAGAVGVTEARTRGQEYLLERRMLRSLSSGEVIDSDWTLFSYPVGYHYDILRGLEYLRQARVAADDRLAEAVDLVERKRTQDGRWLLEHPHRDALDFEMEAVGEPSRWNTLRALRVLEWASFGRGT